MTPNESTAENIDVEATISAGIQATQEAEESATSTRESEPSNPPPPTEVAMPTLKQESTDAPTPTIAPRPTPTVAPFVEPTPTARPTAIPTLTQSPAQTPLPPQVTVTPFNPSPQPSPASAPSLQSRCEDAGAFLIEVSEGDVIDLIAVETVPREGFQNFCRVLVQYASGSVDGIYIAQDNAGELDFGPLALRDWDCKFLLPRILAFNLSNIEDGRTDEEILKVYDAEELRRTSEKLACGGLARTSSGETNIEFSIESDRDGELFYGYVFVNALSRYSEEDEQLFDMFYQCTQEDQQFRQLLRESGFEGMLLYPSRDDFILAITLALEADPSGRRAIESILSLCSIQQ